MLFVLLFIVSTLAQASVLPMEAKLTLLIPLVRGRRTRTIPSLMKIRMFGRKLLMETKLPIQLKHALAASYDTEMIRSTLRARLQMFLDEAQDALEFRKSKNGDRKKSAQMFKASLDVFNDALQKFTSHVTPSNIVFKVLLGDGNKVSATCARLEPLATLLTGLVESLTFRNFEAKLVQLRKASDDYSAVLHQLLDDQEEAIELLSRSSRFWGSADSCDVLRFVEKFHLEEVQFLACLESRFSDLKHFPEQGAIQESLDAMRRISSIVAVELLRNSGKGSRINIVALESFVTACNADGASWTLADRLSHAALFLRVSTLFD